MITEAIAKIVKGENLDKEMAAAVMDEIMSGEATQAQIGSFLTALHLKVKQSRRSQHLLRS